MKNCIDHPLYRKWCSEILAPKSLALSSTQHLLQVTAFHWLQFPIQPLAFRLQPAPCLYSLGFSLLSLTFFLSLFFPRWTFNAVVISAIPYAIFLWTIWIDQCLWFRSANQQKKKPTTAVNYFISSELFIQIFSLTLNRDKESKLHIICGDMSLKTTKLIWL